MLKILGLKRVLLLTILTAGNLLLGLSVYMYLKPETQKQEAQLGALRGQVSTLRGDIDRLTVEFEQLEQQQAEFDVLTKGGFFSRQGRNEAQKIFEKIQTDAKVISAVASVQPGKLVENEEAKKANHALLVSPVSITISALDDVDVFRYLYLVERAFPGHMRIQKVDLQRKSDITNTVFRSIASGNNPMMVQADVSLLWSTMIPQSDVINSTETP